MHGDLKSHDRQLALSVWFLLQQSWRFGRDQTTQRPGGTGGGANAGGFATGVPESRWGRAARARSRSHAERAVDSSTVGDERQASRQTDWVEAAREANHVHGRARDRGDPLHDGEASGTSLHRLGEPQASPHGEGQRSREATYGEVAADDQTPVSRGAPA